MVVVPGTYVAQRGAERLVVGDLAETAALGRPATMVSTSSCQRSNHQHRMPRPPESRTGQPVNVDANSRASMPRGRPPAMHAVERVADRHRSVQPVRRSDTNDCSRPKARGRGRRR